MNKDKIVIKLDKEKIDSEEISESLFRYVDSKIIKNIERVVRDSYEYQLFILLCKNVLNMDHSTYFSNFSLENGFGLEIHHSPFTLYDLVETVCYKHLKINNGWFDDMEVAEEVMRLHFRQMVGLMPVDPTSHELIHSQSLIVHPSIPQGDWEKFIEESRDYLSAELKLKIEEIKILKNSKIEEYPEILKQKTVIIENNKITKLENYNIENLLPNTTKRIK